MNSIRLKLDSLLASYHLDNLVDFPTQVTGTSATAIDNFFINKSINKNFLLTSMANGLSDHDAQILILNKFLFPNSPNYLISRRVINECIKMEFGMRLSHEPLDDVFNIRDDVNLMFNNFLNTYIRVFNHNSKNKIKMSCSIVKAATNTRLANNSVPSINIEGKPCNNVQIIAETINNYFSALLLQTQRSTSSKIFDCLNYLFRVYQHPFPNINMTSVTTNEIKDIIKSLKPKSSHGYDEIPQNIVKKAYHLFCLL
jgi:hypothetical protein